MLSANLDIDRWGYGKNPNGRLDIKYLKAAYQYIEFVRTLEWDKIRRILEENIEEDHNGLKTYLTVGDYVFFQSREDRNLVQTLRMIY